MHLVEYLKPVTIYVERVDVKGVKHCDASRFEEKCKDVCNNARNVGIQDRKNALGRSNIDGTVAAATMKWSASFTKEGFSNKSHCEGSGVCGCVVATYDLGASASVDEL